MRLTDSCLGAYCAGNGNTLRAYVHGKPFSGSPRDVVLCPAAEIALVYGKLGEPSTIPSSYDIPADLGQKPIPGDTTCS